MKNQALFSLKDKSKKLKCRLLQFLFGSLRVNSKITQDRFKIFSGHSAGDITVLQPKRNNIFHFMESEVVCSWSALAVLSQYLGLLHQLATDIIQFLI